MATAKKVEVFEIKPIEIKKVQLRLVGDTPLIMHAWSEKAKRMMLEALWECCARLETSNSMLRSANRALDEQNRRLKDKVQELEAKK